MAIYDNKNAGSLISAIETTPLPDGNFTFFYCNGIEKKNALKQLITSKEVGQEVVAESIVSGNTVLVTHGEKTNDQLMKLLERSGDKFQLREPEKKFNAWKWRGLLSSVGQTLNLVSAYKKPGGIDAPKLTFAGLNFAASFVNSTFGSQKTEDEYQLQYLKRDINNLLDKYLPDGCKIPDINDDRSELRHDLVQSKTMNQKYSDFMKANSVSIGEIGLRYMGSIAMAFPVKNWKPTLGAFRAGGLGKAFSVARNKDATNFYTGATYLLGKTIGLFSKVPDPYNPVPHTALDTIREKYLFQLSTLIETGAATTLAVGNFKQDKNGRRDIIGAAGGVTLMAGLMTRLFAKFGSREVDMSELYAHATDVLALEPRDKLPQLLADSTEAIKEHFKDKATLSYGQIYNKMMTDLYRYHHIAVAPDNKKVSEQKIELNNNGGKHSDIIHQQQDAATSTLLKNIPVTASYADKIKNLPANTTLEIGH